MSSNFLFDTVFVFACSLVILWAKYCLSQTDLSSIPTVGYSHPLLSYITAVKYIFNGPKLVQEGYDKYKGGIFKVATLYHWEVIAGGRQAVEDMRQAPDDVLSFYEHVNRTLQTEYTIGPAIAHNPYHIPIIRQQLTRNLATLFPVVREEIVMAFEDNIPVVGDEWISVPTLKTMMEIVCRTSNRVFVGLPVCRDPEFLKINVDFTVEVVKAGMIINTFPDFLKPLAGKLLSKVPSYINRSVKHLQPIIEERRRKMKEFGNDWEDKPNDILMWLMEEAEDDEQDIRSLTLRILTVNFAAVHTSSMSFTHALHHLAACPEYIQPLREEVDDVVASEGWTKSAMQKLYKVDSFLKECQRVNGLGALSLGRIVSRDFTFSDGSKVPKGAFLSCAASAMHNDDKIYENPDVFNPFRFSDVRGHGHGEETKHQFVATGTDFIAFGHGRHACPGRFFAANELKAMLAHVVSTYDVRLEGNRYPANFSVGSTLVPGHANVQFRKRSVPCNDVCRS